MAALTAVCGPAVEIFLINVLHLYDYAHPQIWGVPTWIPWVYAAGAPAAARARVCSRWGGSCVRMQQARVLARSGWGPVKAISAQTHCAVLSARPGFLTKAPPAFARAGGPAVGGLGRQVWSVLKWRRVQLPQARQAS